MEISKGLQLEIQSVQSKLNNAIRDHQVCVGKLKDDPNNPDILDRIQEIELHIISLGRCQKQVMQRLRKEVDDFKTVNAKDVKVSVASLLGLNNNNNHITAYNETRNDGVSEVRLVSNGHDNVRLLSAKEHYEDVVRNGDVTTRRNNTLKKERSISVETLSADDEEVIEVRVENNSREKERQMSEEPLEERRIKCTEQLSFLEVLGLITTLRSTELQNRRAERKRRSTANPQFVYSSFDMPTKRKRHNYLQSAGNNAPQTRQTTARLNGPSPPPICTKPTNVIAPPKSTSPPSRGLSKSLIPTQKATTTRPNILRNMAESRVFPNKMTRLESENGQLPLTTCTAPTATKTSQSMSSKVVHFPGLPSGLTIERIENDSAVCINCRNPGTLTNCDNCEANYHVSCHSISPPPPRLCPKCALKTMDGTGLLKKNDELAAASYAPGVAGKAGEEPEVDKASRGFYKIGTNARQQIVGASCCVNKLSGSTFLIPIAPNAIPGASITLPKSSSLVVDESASFVESDGKDSVRGSTANAGKLSYTTTIVVSNHLSRSSVTYVPQSADSLGGGLSYTYKLPIYESQKSQKYNDRLAEAAGESDEARTIVEEPSRRNQGEGKVLGRAAVRGVLEDSRKKIDDATTLKEQKQQQRELGKLTGRLAESITRGWKRSSNRAVPGLTRIVQPNDNRRGQRSVAPDHANLDDLDELRDRACVDGNARGERQDGSRNSNGTTTPPSSANEDRNVAVFDDPANYDDKDQFAEGEREAAANKTERRFSRDDNEYRSVADKFHSLFASYNKPDNLTDRTDQSKLRKGTSSSREIFDDEGRNSHGDEDGDVDDDDDDDDDGGDDDDDDDDDNNNDDDDDGDEFQRTTIGPERFQVISSTEHVKLEEAHLSAPSRAKLTRKNENERTAALSGASLNNRLFPSRRRTTEDRTGHQLLEAARLERRPIPRILMRSDRKSLDSRDLPLFRKNRGDSFVRFAAEGNEELAGIDATASSSVGTTETAWNKATIPKDEKEGDGKPSDGTEGGDNLEADEETEDNEEDIEDEEDQDCPIIDEDIREGAIEELRISNVSPESIQVLEQFETAMMQAENADKTANL